MRHSYSAFGSCPVNLVAGRFRAQDLGPVLSVVMLDLRGFRG